jgi:hypothetical protein
MYSSADSSIAANRQRRISSGLSEIARSAMASGQWNRGRIQPHTMGHTRQAATPNANATRKTSSNCGCHPRKSRRELRPGNVGPMGKESCDDALKLGSLPNGCESRSTKAQPGRSGVRLAVLRVTEGLMRRPAKRWAVGMQPRNGPFRESRGFPPLKTVGTPPSQGEAMFLPAGWTTTARRQEGSPVTWEALIGPRKGGAAENPTQVSDAPPVLRTHGRPVQKSVRSEVGRVRGEPQPRPTPQGSRRAAQ